MRIYLRIAKTEKGFKVDADTKPNHKPLVIKGYSVDKVLPTISFGVDINLPLDAFSQAERVLAVVDIRRDQIGTNNIDITP